MHGRKGAQNNELLSRVEQLPFLRTPAGGGGSPAEVSPGPRSPPSAVPRETTTRMVGRGWGEAFSRKRRASAGLWKKFVTFMKALPQSEGTGRRYLSTVKKISNGVLRI